MSSPYSVTTVTTPPTPIPPTKADDQPAIVQFFDSITDNKPKGRSFRSVGTFLSGLTHTRAANREDVELFSLNTYAPKTTRCNENVLGHTALVHEFEKNPDGTAITTDQFSGIVSRLDALGRGYLLYTTYSHLVLKDGITGYRARIVFLLDRPISKDEHRKLWHYTQRIVDFPADPSTKNHDRIWYVPSTPPNGPEPILISRLDRAPLNVNDALVEASLLPLPENSDAERNSDTSEKSYDAATPPLIGHVRDALRYHGPAISGQGGDGHTAQVGAILFNDFALTGDEALPLAYEWNTTCIPPWEPSELRYKLRSGAKSASGEYGKKRDDFNFQQKIITVVCGREKTKARVDVVELLQAAPHFKERATRFEMLLKHLFKRYHGSKKVAARFALLWNESRCSPPLTREEYLPIIKTVLESCSTKGQHNG